MSQLTNYTFDEIGIGQTATYSKHIEEKDIQLFAAVSGDVNPVHLDAEFAATTPFRERIAHGMLTGAVISAAIAMELPGPGTIYLGQSLRFRLPVKIDDEIKHQTYKTKNLICCNGSDALKIKFDLIVCNLPYLATDEILDIATDGGAEGLEIPLKIIKSAIPCLNTTGKFLFVTSSLSNYQALIDSTKKEGLTAKIIAKKKLFFEELILVEVKK